MLEMLQPSPQLVNDTLFVHQSLIKFLKITMDSR